MYIYIHTYVHFYVYILNWNHRVGNGSLCCPKYINQTYKMVRSHHPINSPDKLLEVPGIL